MVFNNHFQNSFIFFFKPIKNQLLESQWSHKALSVIDEGYVRQKVIKAFLFSPKGLWEEEVRKRERRKLPPPCTPYTHTCPSHTPHTHTTHPPQHTHTQPTVEADLLKHPESEKL